MRIKECKALARETLIGRYGTVIGAAILSILLPSLFFMAVLGLVGMLFLHSGIFNTILHLSYPFSFPLLMLGCMLSVAVLIAAVLVNIFLSIGRRKLMLNICRGRKYCIRDIFYAFQFNSHVWRIIAADLILGLITALLNGLPKTLEFLIPVLTHTEHVSLPVSLLISVVFGVIALYVTLRFMFVSMILIDKSETELGRAFGLSSELMKGRKLRGFWLITFSFLLWNIMMVICHLTALWILPYIECTKVVFYLDADDSAWQIPGAKTKAGNVYADFAEEQAPVNHMPAEEAIQQAEDDITETTEKPTETDSWEKLTSEMNAYFPENDNRQETDL